MKEDLAARFPAPVEWISDDDLALARTLFRWAQQEVIERRTSLGESYEELLSPARRTALLDLGLQRSPWPEDLGGDGLPLPGAAMTYALALEQVGRADVGLGVSLAAGLATVAALRPWWSGVDGSMGAALAALFCQDREVSCSVALPRLPAGQQERLLDGRLLQAVVARAGQEWIVDGELTHAVGGVDAGLLAVLCSVEGDADAGPVMVLVPGDAEGLCRGPVRPRLGLAACPAGTITLTGVHVPTGHCVFCGEKGYRSLRVWLQLFFSAITVGALLAGHEILRDWARDRVIKGRGQPLRHNPLAASVLGGVAQRLTVARLLTLQLARALTAPERYAPPHQGSLAVMASTVWQQVTASAEQGLGQAMELMGSAGYAREWNLERYWRDVKALQGQLGSEVLSRVEAAAHYHGSREPGADQGDDS